VIQRLFPLRRTREEVMQLLQSLVERAAYARSVRQLRSWPRCNERPDRYRNHAL
jgi:hypothetical protein